VALAPSRPSERYCPRDYRSRQIDEFQLLEFVRRGFITGPGGEAFGSTGIVVNCPIVMRFL